MTVRVNKPSFNIREKLSELGRKFGLKGSEIAAAETAQEARDLVSAGRRNILINGDYRINQRGSSGALATSGDFVADRWRGYQYLTSSLSTVVGDNSISAIETTGCAKRLNITLTNGSSGYNLIGQRIENSVKELSGKTVTISFWYYTNEQRKFSVELLQYFGSGGSGYVRGIGAKPTEVSATGAWTKFTQTVTIPTVSGKTISSDGYMELAIWLSDAENLVNSGYLGQQPNGTFYVTSIQLEIGSNATDFEHRSYGEELALCQRYYQKIINSSGNASRTIMLGSYTTTRAFGAVPLSVPMRTSTIAFTYSNLVLELINLSNSFAVTSIGRYGTMGDGGAFMGIEANVASGLSGGTIYYLTFQGTGSYLTLTTEL